MEDYRDSEGFLVCGKCGTRKEVIVDFTPVYGYRTKPRKVSCLCKCEQEERKKTEEYYQRKKELIYIGRLRDASLIDKKFEEARFENFKKTKSNQKIFEICKDYADRFDENLKNNLGLLFYGEVGTGKSFAAACIANHLLDLGIPVVMTSFVRLVDLYRTADNPDDIINNIMNARLVIFDDLGAERTTDYALEKVYDIIDRRYNAKMPMILTTNQNMNDMLQEEDMRYKRIYDRIIENCQWVEFKGVSWRKKEAYRRVEAMKERTS